MQGQYPSKLKNNAAPSLKTAIWSLSNHTTYLKSQIFKAKHWAAGLFLSTCLTPAIVNAQSFTDRLQHLSSAQMALAAIFVGGVSFAFLMAILIIKKRIATSIENQRLKASLKHLKKRIELADVLVQAPNQISILWSRDDGKPEIYGDLNHFEDKGIKQNTLPAFGKWLKADSAKSIDDAVKNLRDKTKPFAITIESKKGDTFEANGYPFSGRSIVHFKILSKEHKDRAALYEKHNYLKTQFKALRQSFDTIKAPIWQRNTTGQLIWVNQAYVKATGAASQNDAINNNYELLNTKEESSILNNVQDCFQVAYGKINRTLKVKAANLENDGGTIFISDDITEQQSFDVTLKRNIENHTQILNQLSTAIAIFDGNQNLQFFNDAFCNLWSLSQKDLQGEPDNSAVLNLLRAQNKLEPQPDWVAWKNNLLLAYGKDEATKEVWHLPDNRVIKLAIHPNRHGGASWIFEDMSERISLESNYKSLTQVQHESFDNLKEGICVFGLDGRLKLHNPAFAKLWRIDKELLSHQPHISEIVEHCKTITLKNDIRDHWEELYTTITGFKDQRITEEGQISLEGDKHFHYALVPLPNGQAMLTFVDMSDSIRVEKVLTERNEALEAADRLKDNFIKHVSYELRTPLTHIIGFSDLLQSQISGSLNPKQNEYLEDIKSSSGTLLAIVNDILDLVTVDAGVMFIEQQPIAFEDIIHECLDSVNERLGNKAYSLDIYDACKHDPLMADRLRLKQILVHLITNSVQYSPENSSIHISLAEAKDQHCLTISDDGPGIPRELRKTIFQRFESQTLTQGRGGAGLGLTIVKSLVELHGGRVEIEHMGHDGGTGTTVNCYFPKMSLMLDEAAE